MSANEPIFIRDGYRCVIGGGRAHTVDHRIHGNRKDRRPSNLLSMCGDGTRGHHGWKEAHWALANVRGWTLSKFGVNPAEAAVWLPWCPRGPGWYLLTDDGNLERVELPVPERLDLAGCI